jgi:Zn-finger domain-containing protein
LYVIFLNYGNKNDRLINQRYLMQSDLAWTKLALQHDLGKDLELAAFEVTTYDLKPIK